MFLSRNKKNSAYPCALQFYYIKVGFKGVKIIYRYVFVMGTISHVKADGIHAIWKHVFFFFFFFFFFFLSRMRTAKAPHFTRFFRSA